MSVPAPYKQTEKPILCNTQDLRLFLIDQMVKSARGEIDLRQARAVTGFAQQIYNTLNLELRAAVATARIGGMEIKSVELKTE